jgi:predicted RNA-binding protein associated with RNAse of E/G family
MFRDLWIDVMVPTDGRHYRMLDLDEFADAVDQRLLPLEVALDGLRRWQRFLDEFLHHERDPRASWTDFPPAVFDDLAALPGPFTTALRST